MAPWGRTIRALGAAGLTVGALAACEPAPPRLQLEVTTAANGADSDPGDGVCSSAAAGGACTLQAAIEEGNLAPDGADVLVPALHVKGLDATVTGDVALRPAGPSSFTITDATITVAAGGRLALDGANTSPSIGASQPSFPTNPSSSVSLLDLVVEGRADVVGSMLGSLEIAAGGGALLADSVVRLATTANEGALLAVRSSFLGPSQNGTGVVALQSSPGATSLLVGSVVANPHVSTNLSVHFPGGQGTCAGTAPTSGGHLHVEVPCGPLEGPSDGSGDAEVQGTVTYEFTGIGYREVGHALSLQPGSPLIDAIPIGHPACQPGSVDVYGNPRGVDGDGDGMGGCDIGAVERQP